MHALFDEQELIAEMLRIVADARRRLAENERDPLMRAGLEASGRDLQTGNFAAGLVQKLVDGTGADTEAERLERARAVLESPTPGDPLAAATFDLVRRASGENVDCDDVWERGKKLARMNRKPRATRAPESSAIAVAEAEPTLRAMLGDAGLDGALPSPHAVWSVFRSFAELPVAEVQHDARLFQWGTYDSRFVWDLTRQFTLEDEYGDYDHMEQLRCTFSFERDSRLDGLGSGEVWSTTGLSAWFSEVEAQAAFARVANCAGPVEVRIGQERV